MKKLNNSAFSLVEMMVVAGIGSILATTIAQLLITQFNALNAIKFKSDAANMATVGKMVLQSETSCTANLAAGNFGATPTYLYRLRPRHL